MATAGIPIDYPEAFGTFYDWKTGNQMKLSALLTDNTSILLSSKQAEKLGLTKDTPLPIHFNYRIHQPHSRNIPTTDGSIIQLDDEFQLHHRQLCILNSNELGLHLELTPTNSIQHGNSFHNQWSQTNSIRLHLRQRHSNRIRQRQNRTGFLNGNRKHHRHSKLHRPNHTQLQPHLI